MSYPNPYGYPSPYGPAPPGSYPMQPGIYPAYHAPPMGGYPVGQAAPPPCGYPGYPQQPGFYPAPPPYGAVPCAIPAAAPAAPHKSYYFIRSRLNGLVLDISGANRNPGAAVVLWTQKSSDCDNQLWYDDFATGTIRSKMHDFCLDVEGESLVVKPYNVNNLNQQLERAEPFIRSKLTPNRVLDIRGGNKQPGAQVIMFEKHGNVNQCFDVQFTAPPPVAQPRRQKFHIVSEMNCKVLDIRGDNATSGAQVIMFSKKGGKCPNQLWYFDGNGVIRSALNDFALEARTNGSKVTMMPFTDSPHQRWKLVGNKIMKNAVECLDISGESRNDCADVISWSYKGSSNQHWRLEYA